MACKPCERERSELKTEWTVRKVAHGVKGQARRVLGIGRLDPPDVLIRLQICVPCEFRTEANRCQPCGCPIHAKAQDRAERCPKGKWPSLPQPERSES